MFNNRISKKDNKYLNDSLKNKKVLITGGLGMLGSALAHRLVMCKAKVTLLDARLSPYGSNL